jgi:hypothetical protein
MYTNYVDEDVENEWPVGTRNYEKSIISGGVSATYKF